MYKLTFKPYPTQAVGNLPKRSAAPALRWLVNAALASLVLTLTGCTLSINKAINEQLRREWVAGAVDSTDFNKRAWWRDLSLYRLQLYIEAGADLQIKDRKGNTPLHWAAYWNSDPEVVATLLDAGADVQATAEQGYTPLHFAVGSNLGVITTLLDAGANAQAKDTFDSIPLHGAAFGNVNPAVITTLLDAGAELQATDNTGSTPLHWAAARSFNPDVIITLLNAGADKQLKDLRGNTPLDLLEKNNNMSKSDKARAREMLQISGG